MQIITTNFKVDSNKEPIIVSFYSEKEKIRFFSSLVSNKEAQLIILFPTNKEWNEEKRREWLKQITKGNQIEFNEELNVYIIKKGENK